MKNEIWKTKFEKWNLKNKLVTWRVNLKNEIRKWKKTAIWKKNAKVFNKQGIKYYNAFQKLKKFGIWFSVNAMT